MRLRNVQAYPIKDVPDHLTFECQELGKLLMITLQPTLKEKAPHIVLGALTFLHAAIIKSLVSDDPEEVKKAAQITAFALLKNIDFLIEVDKKNAQKDKTI